MQVRTAADTTQNQLATEQRIGAYQHNKINAAQTAALDLVDDGRGALRRSSSDTSALATASQRRLRLSATFDVSQAGRDQHVPSAGGIVKAGGGHSASPCTGMHDQPASPSLSPLRRLTRGLRCAPWPSPLRDAGCISSLHDDRHQRRLYVSGLDATTGRHRRAERASCRRQSARWRIHRYEL